MSWTLLSGILAAALCAGTLMGSADNLESASPNNQQAGSGTSNQGGETSDQETVGAAADLSDERYQTQGKVVVAAHSSIGADYKQLLQKFNTYYPDIEVELTNYETTTSEYLTAQASTGQMPDVVLDDADEFYYYVSQGWVYPLTDFVKDDEEFTYIPDNIIQLNTYMDELYSFPED